jgi:hypothetical protein
MAKELIDILTRAAEVRDETGAAENNLNRAVCLGWIYFIVIGQIFRLFDRTPISQIRELNLGEMVQGKIR